MEGRVVGVMRLIRYRIATWMQGYGVGVPESHGMISLGIGWWGWELD